MINIPDYIQEEMDHYKLKRRNGNSGIATLENALALVGLAKVNNRITEEEALKIREEVLRLEHKKY